MARMRTWAATHRAVTGGLVLVALFASAFAAVGIALATDQPTFCGSACHEMSPFHTAWSAGPHAGIGCVDCHVEPGVPARVSHKAEAMRELWSHFSEQPAFPQQVAAVVPDERCLRCHEKIENTTAGFDHEQHAKRGRCQSCHADAGHNVTHAALKDAGIFNVDATRTAFSAGVAAVDGGAANVPGHIAIPCTRCHDLAKTGCSTCHKPDHSETGPATKTAPCETCHQPATEFAFTHPTEEPNCASCHTPPATKHEFTGECATCHTTPGVSWTFKHPGSSTTCTTCHTRPSTHREGSCATCHKTGKSWAFRHPSEGSCASCHQRPANHRSGACQSCHGSAGSAWSFSHPGSGASCTSCHSRPAGHSSGRCSSCHRAGRSWAFRHSNSLPCSSCHDAPSGHYGSSCTSCHSPSRAFSRATFRHVRIRGGEHTYRSFACASCHPNGKSTHTCSKCHSSSSGPKDD